MKISFSIADLPLNLAAGDLFRLASELGFDGVEVLPGIKTFTLSRLEKLSQKYNMPILSIHYPFWLGKYVISSRKAFEAARSLNAILVVHPLKKYALSSIAQKKFMDQVSLRSREYGVPVTIENMPQQSRLPIYKHFSKADESTTQLLPLYKLCKKYSSGITLDTSHLQTQDITSVNGFSQISPLIRNIHLSDCNEYKQHLAVGEGYIDFEQFIKYLKKIHYESLLTFELSPKIYAGKGKYYNDLERSLLTVRKYLKPEKDARAKLKL